MTAVSQPIAETPSRSAARQPPRKILHYIDHWALPVFTFLAICYLLVPIFVMIVFSFNDYQGKFNFVWHGFTLNGWLHPFDWPGLPDAIRTSLTIAFLSTFFATILGTFIGLALTRYHFRGRGAINGLIFLPMATPEIVMGASLLTLFVSAGLQGGILNGIAPKGLLFPLGFSTILIAHIMFNISFVVVTVKARIAGLDRRLEEAAADLGADELTTFRKITFPLILPGVMAAGLLAFSLSIDDFIITSFVSGTTNTFPIWAYSIIKNALPVQINVVGSMVFLGAVLIVGLSSIRNARAASR
jgi:spermidine/putrescine transport system permease protein